MSKILVTFEADWADEFSVYGFKVYDLESWELTKKEFLAAEYYSSYYFGTNEGWDDDEIDKDWLDNYEVQAISDEQAKVLDDLFDSEFGDFVNPIEIIGENEENENLDL